MLKNSKRVKLKAIIVGATLSALAAANPTAAPKEGSVLNPGSLKNETRPTQTLNQLEQQLQQKSAKIQILGRALTADEKKQVSTIEESLVMISQLKKRLQSVGL